MSAITNDVSMAKLSCAETQGRDRIEGTPTALVDSAVSCQPAYPPSKEKEMQIEIEYCGM